jgi:hypothetical protein
MSDALYLSLWYPNLRLATMPDKLVAVLGEFAKHGGEPLVYSATVWPVSWSESPVFQQVYGRRASGYAQPGAEPRAAVEEALEFLYDDYAYEFQIGWNLWELETVPDWAGGKATADPSTSPSLRSGSAQDDKALDEAGRQPNAGPSTPLRSAQDDNSGSRLVVSHSSDKDKNVARVGHPGQDDKVSGLDPRWVRGPRLVRVIAFGPLFDEGAYEQDGHHRIDFGNDAPFLEEEAELNSIAARHMEENVRQLVGLTAAVETASGATARVLWSELGESLAQRLAARIGQGN